MTFLLDPMIPCGGCQHLMTAPHVMDADELELCVDCSGFLCGLGCGRFCPPDDRLPYVNGGKPGHVHAVCALRATNALGLQWSSTLIARRGPAFRGHA